MAEQETVLSLVTNTSLDVSKFVVASDANVDPTLQKEVDFMNSWMARAAETNIPFIPVVSKKKKGNKNTTTAYQTRSSGPVPP